MKTDSLPQKSFERNMNHNYMILNQPNFFHEQEEEQDYRVRMLLDNKIEGLLPVSDRTVNGESKYYYEINSLQSMDRVYAKEELDYQQLCTLLQGCIHLYDSLEEYLLDGSQVILKPEYIYLNMDSLEPYFVYFPEYESNARDSFASFIEELLRKVDHTDEQAVMLAYQVYRYTRNTNYVLREITQMMEQTKEDIPPQQQMPYESEDSYRQEAHYDDWDSISYTSSSPVDKQEEPKSENHTANVNTEKRDLKKAVMCFILTGIAAVLLAGCKVAGLYPLDEKQILYLYGAVSMSVMAGVIFLACHFKKKNRMKEIQELQEDSPLEKHEFVEYPTYRPEERTYEEAHSWEKEPVVQQQYAYGDTICLQQLPDREPYLSGRINGEDIMIRLDNLPLTIGKMTGRVDYVISDSTVSKIHARIEERNGAIYVEDLNSTNGTLRNGSMIGMNEPVLLQVGDELTIGRVNLRVCA